MKGHTLAVHEQIITSEYCDIYADLGVVKDVHPVCFILLAVIFGEFDSVRTNSGLRFTTRVAPIGRLCS